MLRLLSLHLEQKKVLQKSFAVARKTSLSSVQMINFFVRHPHSIGLPNCHHARKTVLNKDLMNITLRLPGLESRDAGPCRHDRRFWDLSCCVNTWDVSSYEHFLATQMQLRHMRRGQGHCDTSRTTSSSRRWHSDIVVGTDALFCLVGSYNTPRQRRKKGVVQLFGALPHALSWMILFWKIATVNYRTIIVSIDSPILANSLATLPALTQFGFRKLLDAILLSWKECSRGTVYHVYANTVISYSRMQLRC